MSKTSELDRVWTIIEKVGVCMLTTRSAGGLRARPLEARIDRRSGCLLFVTDTHSAKRDEIDRWSDVGLVFIDAADKAYLSMTATARIEDDPALRASAWRKTDVVWWPGGPNDPDACVLVCEPVTAELWDGPSNAAVAAYEFAKSLASGIEPDLGENRKVTLDMKTIES
jgi:general stress protein 26